MYNYLTERYGSFLRLFFYGSLFLGLLVIVLSIETAFQLAIPLADFTYYIVTGLAVIVFYTYAYTHGITTRDGRGRWYNTYRTPIYYTRVVGIVLLCFLGIGWLSGQARFLLHTPWYVLIGLLSFPVIALAYYGTLLSSRLSSLRTIGWIKPLVIGYVWAGIVTLYPLVGSKHLLSDGLEHIIVYFGYNWMLFTVNAILFDIKDQAVDKELSLKTIVIRLGVARTIQRVVLPLVLVSLLCFVYFAYLQQFSYLRILTNLLPFVLLIGPVKALTAKQYTILYYLVRIDGLLLVKAIIGILAAMIW